MTISKMLRFVVPVLVAAGAWAVWAPVVKHYYVTAPDVSAAVVQQARAVPADSVLLELTRYRLLAIGPRDTTALRRAADRLLGGLAVFPGYPAARVTLPFAPRDLDHLPRAWQLPFAGLTLARPLLDAYDASGRDEFLFAARDMILAWGRYEGRALVPRGLLWNDHAVAARVGVLVQFWARYRHHPSYDPAVGQAVLYEVSRGAALLARREHFTYSTNHGVMENLALLQFAVAFPSLPEVHRYREVAIARLSQQLPFYIDDEGVVLEHSAGYQAMGVNLLAMACRYLTLLEAPIPPEWRRKLERATDVWATLQRPDGSLPTFGDTEGGPDIEPPFGAVFNTAGTVVALHHAGGRNGPQPAVTLAPVAGEAIWWDDMRQTVVHWSNFAGHGHKHADEMSLVVWGNGQPWWIGAGYWPYVLPGRENAESWPGSNAPHIRGEDGESARHTTLLGSGSSQRLGVLDLERSGPDGYIARRQVVRVKPDLWIVIDHMAGGDSLRTTTSWTTSPDILLRRGPAPDSYMLLAPGHRGEMTATFFGSPGTRRTEVSGSLTPFAGWQVVNGIPRAASAIVIDQPARAAWAIAVWSLSGHTPRVVRSDLLNWRVELTGPEGSTVVERVQDRIVLRDARNRALATLALSTPPDPRPARAPIEAAFAAAASVYPPRFADEITHRLKVTGLLIAVLLAQWLVVSFLRRRQVEPDRPRQSPLLALAAR